MACGSSFSRYSLLTDVFPSALLQTPASFVPPDSLYFDGFEQATFPNREWSTDGDGVWELTTEQARSGIHSIRSPVFVKEGPDDTSTKRSNVTFTTDEAWPSGDIVFSALAGTNMPFDTFQLFVDGQQRGSYAADTTFTTQRVQLAPGQHDVTFSYVFNPVELQDFPPEPPGRIGAVFLDDVYFLPAGATIRPTLSPTSASNVVRTLVTVARFCLIRCNPQAH